MSEKIVQLNEEIIKGQLKELVRGSVEETLNELLEKKAESLTQAARYERSEPEIRATAAATMTATLLPLPVMLRSTYPGSRAYPSRLPSSSGIAAGRAAWEEALIEMYLAGVSVRRVEDITEALWGAARSRPPPSAS